MTLDVDYFLILNRLIVLSTHYTFSQLKLMSSAYMFYSTNSLKPTDNMFTIRYYAESSKSSYLKEYLAFLL